MSYVDRSSARTLGVTDSSIPSLKRFDDWYFDFYPYLLPFVSAAGLKGSHVLEVGLSYGSLSQKVAEFGATYSGLDIAVGLVGMVNHRLASAERPAGLCQGSVLECPFPDQSFDVAVAIGSLHHTGNLALALQELHRVPGGIWFSCLQWIVVQALGSLAASTMSHVLWARGNLARKPLSSENERRAYDADEQGNAAPETVFCSTGDCGK
jgi:SAM-dependent methyltransferase